MSDTARDYQPTDPASIDGLENLFTPAQEDLQEELHEVEDGGGQEDLLEVVSLSEAAKLLSVHRRYALDLIHKGKLTAFKNPKGQWQVPRKAIEERSENTQSDNQEDLLEVVDEVEEGPPEGLQEDLLEVDPPGDPDPLLDSFKDRLIFELQSKLDEKDTQLQSATYRIGWLESQVQERESDIQELKLIVDHQSKTGWWTRFTNWFLGR